MEFDMLEVLLGHLQNIAAVGQEDVSSVAVFCHILVFALLERLQFCLVIALNPACFIEADWFPAAFGVVFILQAVLDDFKLQLTNGADQLTTIKLVDKELGHTFIHQLFDAFVQLLGLHRIGILYVLEHFRRERRQTSEMELLALCQGVANLEDAVVRQADDVASPRFVDGALSLRHKLGW